MPPRRVAEKAKVVKNAPARKRGRPKSIGVIKSVLSEAPENLNSSTEIIGTPFQEATISDEKTKISTNEDTAVDLKMEIESVEVVDLKAEIEPIEVVDLEAEIEPIEVVDLKAEIEPIKVVDLKTELEPIKVVDLKTEIQPINFVDEKSAAETNENANLFVHVTNLVRPFTIVDLYALLSSVGKFDHDLFWIDFIKSNCYVKFDSLEIARAAIERLNGSVWPDHNPKKLQADYADHQQMYVDTDGKLGTKESSPPKLNCSKHTVPKIVIQSFESECEIKPTSQLADLFNKTACEPHIYWLSQLNNNPPTEDCDTSPPVSHDQKVESK